MKENILEQGTSYKILNEVFNSPHRAFHIRELSRITKQSTTAVTRAITTLQKQKLIKIEAGILKNITANMDYELYSQYKMLFNIEVIIKLGITKEIKETYNNPECILLFGSFAKGEDIEESDIDILIITQKINNKISKEKIESLEKTFNRKISLHILKSLNKSSDEFKNSVSNGIILYGYLKVI